MFLTNYIKTLEKQEVKLFQKQYGTFTTAFEYWKDNLFERIMKIFVWENTDPIPPHEIEMRLILSGVCGIANFSENNQPAELTAFFGNYEGVSKYFDLKPNFVARCPVWSGVLTVNKDIIVLHNNSLQNPSINLVDRYAFLLAHTEVTLARMMIEARDAGGVPVATSESQKQSIETYNRKLYNGEDGVITDLAALGVQYAGMNRSAAGQSVGDVMEVRQKLLKNFYSDIGIRASFEKRSNAVVDEVEADTTMLLFNDDDMLACRKEGAEKVNAAFGTNWSVKLNPSIEKGLKGGNKDGDPNQTNKDSRDAADDSRNE